MLDSRQITIHPSDTLDNRSIPKKNHAGEKPDDIDSGKTIIHKDQLALAANMKENLLYENLIASHYRSNDIEVSFPPINHTFHPGQPLNFKLSGEITDPMILIIYNNKGEKIIEKNSLMVTGFSIKYKSPTGLYYWKLLKGDDLIQVGKYFVK
jgi:hypothetical protein